MHKLYKTIPVVALALVAGYFALSAIPASADDAEARKAQILSNLKLRFPQLDKMAITMGELKPSGFEGLDEGSFTVTNRGQAQNQRFFVTSDNSKLFLVSDEIDVSRTAADIEAEIAQRAEAEARRAVEIRAQLDSSIAGLPVRGNPNAAVTIVEFSDFQCPYCSRGAATVEQILEKYGDDVKFVFKHFPLNFHPWAKPAAIASHCAGVQDHDAFWTLHDKYFEHQQEINPGNVLAKSREFLASSGLDMDKWSTCAENQESPEYKAAARVVADDMAFGQRIGVSGTPGFFVNGHFLSGAQPLSAFEPLIAQAKAES